MKKRIMSLLLCLCMAVMLLPTAAWAENEVTAEDAVASVTIGENTTYYETIEAAWAAATAERDTVSTITLLKDATVTDWIELKMDYNVTINFAGGDHTLSNTHDITLIGVWNATLNVISGTISSPGIAIWNRTGNVNISGGAITNNSVSGWRAMDCSSGSTTTISGDAQISSMNIGIGMAGGTVIINGGTVTGGQRRYGRAYTCGIDIQDGKLVVNGGTIGSEICDYGVLANVLMTGKEAMSGEKYNAFSAGAAEIKGGTIQGKDCGLFTYNFNEVDISGDATIKAASSSCPGISFNSLSEINGVPITLPEKTPALSGGTFIGGISINDSDKTLADLLKEDEEMTYAYFKDGEQVSDMSGQSLTGTVTVGKAKEAAVLNISAATSDVEDEDSGTKKQVVLTVSGTEDILSEVAVSAPTGITLKRDGNTWTGNLPEGSDETYEFKAVFAGNETYLPAQAACSVKGDGTVHVHSWAAAWSSDADGHWHDCTVSDCTVNENSAKDGYAAHVYDNSQDTSCNICGYTRRVSSGSSGGSSGGSTGGSTSSTTTNPDGSTTTTTENKATGTVTETTKSPDGSQTVVETKKDGTVTTTETDKDGNRTETVEKTDGSSVTTVQQKDGTTASVMTDAEGKTEAEVKLPDAVVAAAQESGETVTLPIPGVQATRSTDSAPAVTVKTNSSEAVKVEIPTANVTPGTVAVLVNSDGAEKIIKTSVPTADGVAVALSDGATVKIVDNSKNFDDVSDGHWASDAVDFASARELLSGTSENTFDPQAPMTRAMLMTVLARYDGEDTSGGATWYEKGMNWAVSNGVSDGSDPGNEITREQLAVMLWRYSGSPEADGELDGFTDAGSISDYAAEAMRWAVSKGIINGFGNGLLGPHEMATRAQVAQMLRNFIEI